MRSLLLGLLLLLLSPPLRAETPPLDGMWKCNIGRALRG